MIVNNVKTSFLDNEYYKVYADFYGKYFYDKYNDGLDSVIDDKLYSSILSSSEIRYITVVMKESYNSISEVLDIKDENVVAECNDYPVTMIKISPEKLNDLIDNEFVVAIFDAFPQATNPFVVNDAILEETYTPTAADVRKILRYVAKLDDAPEDMAEGKRFFFMSDADFDGKITVADARLALRISAKIENGSTYYKSTNGAGAFWMETYR